MQTIGLALRNTEDVGLALPSVFPTLENMGAKFRRGQLSLIAGGPGTGKSALASYIAANAGYGEYGETGVPTLYFSADTDKRTLGNRITASVTHMTVDEAEDNLLANHPGTMQLLDDNTSHIWFNWNNGPNVDDIQDEVEAFAHVNGQWPHLIIIDNLKNVWVEASGEGGEHIRYDRVLDFLHELAGLTNAHVMVLHHVAGIYDNGDQPIPLSGILGKVTKPFRLIITLYKPNENQIALSIVKNSTGKMDQSGKLACYLGIDLSRQQFIDTPLEEQAVNANAGIPT
ncbi:MAG: AAA family ATPase [Chitinophagaceae bacterium]